MPANPLFSRAHSTFYQHVLSTLKVVQKKIKPPLALYLSGLKTVFINTFCPITLNLSPRNTKTPSPYICLLSQIQYREGVFTLLWDYNFIICFYKQFLFCSFSVVYDYSCHSCQCSSKNYHIHEHA